METGEIKIIRRHYATVLKKNNYSDILKVILAVFENQKGQLLELMLLADQGDGKEKLSVWEEDSIGEKIVNDPNRSRDVIRRIKDKKDANPPCLLDINIFIGIIEGLFSKCDSLTIGIEDKYIDREFRDSYYSHYSEWHLEMPRYCKRLVIFKDDRLAQLNMRQEKDCSDLRSNFLGSIVIRPIENVAIGRSLIGFSSGLCTGYVRKGNYKITYRGLELDVFAFPYSMQDRTTTTCAEVTLLNLLDYYSNQYTDYQFLLPSQISNTIKQSHYDRVLPTLGLSYQNISKVLCKTGFTPKLYAAKENDHPKDASYSDIRRFLSYYMESGIPVAIGLNNAGKKHSVVCIGHGECDKKFAVTKKNILWDHEEDFYYCSSIYSYNKFIVQDDTRIPYSTMTEIVNNQFAFDENDINASILIQCLVAPLYKKMYMDAQRAEATIKTIFNTAELSPMKCCEKIKIGESKENPLIYRLFLASSRHFKQSRINNVDNQWLKVLYAEIALPQFIWVCELYNIEGYEGDMALGEIVLDATYSGSNNMIESCLMINYPDKHMAKDQWNESLFCIPNKNGNKEESVGGFDLVQVDMDRINIYPSYKRNLFSTDEGSSKK